MKKKTWYLDNENEEKSTNRKKEMAGKKRGFQKAGRVATTSVIFVPNTKGGTLTRKLREREDELSSVTGFRIRFQEAGGRQLKNLFNTDLGAGLHCGRTPCPPCDMNGDKRKL